LTTQRLIHAGVGNNANRKETMNIFIITWVCWFLSEVLLHKLFRSKTNKSKKLDGNSLIFIWITIIISISLGVLGLIYLPTPIFKSNVISYLGLMVIIIGMIIRFIAIRTLGKFFTVDLGTDKGHSLINKGLYNYIRHPSYSGSLLSFLGLGLSLNNWISLLVIFVPILFAFIYRINIEETLLLAQFGSDYQDYKNHTKRLIPLIY
jgi:protein-S-isoprenylcysteine O-methyltransferase Ste14